MKLNSNLNFTRPLMFYLQTEAVLKASFFFNGGCLTETPFPELYSTDWNCLGTTFIKQINSVKPNFDLNSKRRFNIRSNYS